MATIQTIGRAADIVGVGLRGYPLVCVRDLSKVEPSGRGAATECRPYNILPDTRLSAFIRGPDQFASIILCRYHSLPNKLSIQGLPKGQHVRSPSSSPPAAKNREPTCTRSRDATCSRRFHTSLVCLCRRESTTRDHLDAGRAQSLRRRNSKRSCRR